ncbi:MAG: hypothetical protein BGO69_04850 [Bacteroidetes bacterium 46-16]|nr:MAG: hypothetical protein BGO69_04850 [Bacteroidetes bacterium 46-16]
MRIVCMIACCLWSMQVGAQVKFVKTSNTDYRSIDYNRVTIYLSEDKVPKGAEQIGLVLCEGDNLSKQMIRAKKKASDYGANGLYMVKGDDNDILTSRRVDDREKDLEVNGKRKTDYQAHMTFVAVRVAKPLAIDTVSAETQMALAQRYSVNEEVFFNENGRVLKGVIIGKNDTYAIVSRHRNKRQVPYSKITKMTK